MNVGVVAGNSSPLNSALGWKGPDDAAKSGGLQLPTDDNWLNEDQSATRIHHEATRCARAKKRLHF